MAKIALITGISRQDGSYLFLARFLFDRGCRVVGAHRRTSGAMTGRLAELGVAQGVEVVVELLGVRLRIDVPSHSFGM